MKKMKRVIVVIVALAFTLGVKAQEESGLSFSVGADIVSSYVWRGLYQTGTAVQPAASLSIGGFSLSAWGSVPVGNTGSTDENGVVSFSTPKEVDFTASYEIAGLSLAITDYWLADEGTYQYFNYDKDKESGHVLEATVGYTLPVESFPLSLTWNTNIAGTDYVKDGDVAYSTYIEAAYPFAIKSVNLDAALGFTPWEGAYSPDGFNVINISLKASKEIKITDSFSLPAFGQIIVNPNSEGIYFVFGISL
jgi:hypothetical protein